MEKKERSELEKIIDSSIEDFSKAMKNQNIGTIKMLVSVLSNTYSQLVEMKNAIIKNDEIPLEKKRETIGGIYSELLKIEEKVIFLKSLEKTLQLSDFDSKK